VKKPTHTRLPTMECPDCRARMITRSSEPVTASVRELRLVCSDPDCGAYFYGQLALVRTVRRGPTPNPDVRLPFASLPRPANENMRTPANDVTGLGAAIGALMTT